MAKSTKPSVSKLIKLLDKPALVDWANKLGLKGVSIDEYMETKKARGTSIHQHIENALKLKMPMPTHQAEFDEFFKNKEILGAEERIETDDFIGVCDVRFRYNGQNYVGDFKSSSVMYFEHKLQIAAYSMAFRDHEVCIIHVPLFTWGIVEEDLKPYKQIIKHLAGIYNIKEKLNESIGSA